MLIVALVLAVIGLAALVTAVVTSNEVIAWVCIGASALGVILLVVDAIRERQSRRAAAAAVAAEPAAEPTTEIIDEAIDEAIDEETPAVAEAETDVAATELVAGEPIGDPPDAETDIDIDREIEVEDHPDEMIHDEPDYDLDSDDEPEYPESAEEAAIHVVDDPESPVEELVIEESVSEKEGR